MIFIVTPRTHIQFLHWKLAALPALVSRLTDTVTFCTVEVNEVLRHDIHWLQTVESRGDTEDPE